MIFTKIKKTLLEKLRVAQPAMFFISIIKSSDIYS